MNRAEKTAAIEQMNQLFLASPHVVVATFRGLTVNQVNDLRDRVRDAGGRYQVIKNRLAKLAVVDTPAAALADRFEGPCAVVSHETEPVVLAKTLAEFIKDHQQIQLLAGIIDAQDLLDAAGIEQLSKLPSLPELQAQLLSLIQTPATTLVRLIGTPGTQIARVLSARGEAAEQEN